MVRRTEMDPGEEKSAVFSKVVGKVVSRALNTVQSPRPTPRAAPGRVRESRRLGRQVVGG